MTPTGKSVLPALDIPGPVCRDLGAALDLEWLESNGLGGYASSTVAGINTRRYHGLLVAALSPPTGRMVLLNKIDETVETCGGAWQFGANLFPGAVHPRGHEHIVSFHLDPFPRWLYQAGELLFEKTMRVQG